MCYHRSKEDEAMTYERRVERLERENRWTRAIGAVCIVVVALALLTGQGRPPDLPDLKVRSIELWSEDQLHARLDAHEGLRNGFKELHFFAKDEKLNAAGLNRIVLSLGIRQESPYVALYDANGRVRAKLAVTESGNPMLEFRDADGKVIWRAPEE
jgi:hypothetical protein